MIPGIGHAQAVASDHIHAGFLTEETNVARIGRGNLLGNDDDALEVVVETYQLAHGLTHGAGR